ncbi:MAG: MATE family multidrug resistance protein [Myxococcota bacterium]|jgi:MATE family multidrug resistance protein
MAHSSVLPARIHTMTVLGLAWPIMVSMLSHTAMNVVDTIFVGRLGTAQLAALGLAMTLCWLLHSFVNGILSGLKIAISQRVGAQDEAAAGRLAWQGLWIAGIAGALIAATGPLGEPLFDLMGGSQAVRDYATAFFSIRMLGAPMLFAIFSMNAWFHGHGETRLPMVAALVGNAVNIALDPILIEIYGVQGAAAATVIGLTTSALWLAWRLWPQLIGVAHHIERRWLSEVWRLGSPIGTRYLLEVGSFAIFAAMLAQAGDAELAAHVLVIRIVSVSFLPGYAIGEAASVLVGQAVGARKPRLARQATRRSLELAVGIMAACGLAFWLLPGPLMAPFSVTEEVASVAAGLLLVAALFQIFDAVAMICLSALNGAGDVRFTMLLSVGAAWLVKLPIGWLLALPLSMGAVGAWLGLLVEIIVVAGIALWRTRGEAWLAKGPAAVESDRAAAK